MPIYTVKLNGEVLIQAKDMDTAVKRSELLDIAVYRDGTRPYSPAWLKDTVDFTIEEIEEPDED